MVHGRDDMVGLDAAVIMHPKTWEASGHASNFSDPFIQCVKCRRYYRLDKIWDEIWESPWWKSLLDTTKKEKDFSEILKWAKGKGKQLAPNLALVENPEVTISWMIDLRQEFKAVDLDFKNFVGRMASDADGRQRIPCPSCGETLPETGTPANLMLKTSLGPVVETAEQVYLRPETAQGIFVNFKNILDSSHKKLPFGVAQVGKSFRNEVTPGNFTFRTREFEQMEIEYFCSHDESDKYYEDWIKLRHAWYLNLGMNTAHLRLRPHAKDELAHYARGCTDIEYLFPFGWSELEGIAHRGDFDLKQHAEFSGVDMQYFDQVKNERFFPHVIEPSGGVDRATLAFLVDAYHEEEVEGRERVVLKLDKQLAPRKVAILPLLKKNDGLVALAKEIKNNLQKTYACVYDDTASIGKLYRRQDEVGTCFCVTVDVDSLTDKKVTIRERDTMSQVRVDVENLKKYIDEQFNK